MRATSARSASRKRPSPRRSPTPTSGCRPPRPAWWTSYARPSPSAPRCSSPAIPASARPASSAPCASGSPRPATASPTATTPRWVDATSYRQLCLALSLDPKASAAGVFYAVSTHIQDLGNERVHPVFLIDEAHLLHPEMLGHLHILLNYEWDSKALLSLILVGLPELKDQLKMRRFRSLHSRLHWRLHIDPLTPEDTAEYLRYRMKRAGCDRDVFTQDAVQMLHEAATGGMRDLDRLATGCLREAARRKRKLVERDLLPRVLDRDGLERAG